MDWNIISLKLFLYCIEGENVVDIEQEVAMSISNQFLQVVRMVFSKKKKNSTFGRNIFLFSG